MVVGVEDGIEGINADGKKKIKLFLKLSHPKHNEGTHSPRECPPSPRTPWTSTRGGAKAGSEDFPAGETKAPEVLFLENLKADVFLHFPDGPSIQGVKSAPKLPQS